MDEVTPHQSWQRYLPLLVNLLFLGLSLAFFAYAQPWLLARTVSVYQERTTDALLGGVMIAAGVIEIIGLYLKWPHWQAQPPLRKPWQVIGISLILMCHGFIDMIWGFFLLVSFNLMDFASPLQCIFGPLVLIFIFLHMALVLTAIYSFMGSADGKFPAIQRMPATAPLGMLGDTALLVSSLVMFCISWDFMQAISPPPTGVISLLGYSLFYVWCYFPARAFSILPEWQSQPGRVQQVLFWGLFLAGWLGTFHLLPGG
jgi:hypothetical protein